MAKRFAQLCVITLITLFLGEGLTRLAIKTDGEYEWVSFLNIRVFIPPYPHPATRVAEILNPATESETLAVYDPLLGYTYRPSLADPKARSIHNSQSIRVGDLAKKFSTTPDPGTFRIAIFGDSFTHGDGSDYFHSWGNQLEIELNRLGLKSEVLNFGVGGYAQDQAFLRYLRKGVIFQPDLVIFGFAIENIRRNLYLFRYFYKQGRAGIPLSKPRFVLKDDQMILINSPTPSPQKTVKILENFSDWKLAEYETFYHEDEYHARFWHHSRLLSLLVAVFREYKISRADNFPDGEAYLLSQAIIEAFATSVQSNNSKFMIVHLPPRNHFKDYANSGQFRYERQLETLESKYLVMRPEKDMLIAAPEDSGDQLFADHFSALGHEVIGKSLARYIKNQPTLRKQ